MLWTIGIMSPGQSQDRILAPALYSSEWKEIVLEIEELKIKDSLQNSVIGLQKNLILTLNKKLELNELLVQETTMLYEKEKELNNELTRFIKKRDRGFFEIISEHILVFCSGLGTGMFIALILF